MIGKSSIISLRRKLEKEAWEIKSLGEIATEISFGGEFKKDQLGKGNYPAICWYEILREKGNIHIEQCSNRISLDGIRKPRYCQYGNLLVASCCRRIDNLGKAVVYLGNEKPIIERDIIKVEHNENPKFLLYLLFTKFVKKQIYKSVEDTAIVHLKIKHLQKIKIPLPPKHIQDKVADFLGKFSSLKEQIEEELNRELDQRKKQYEYYKEAIFNGGVDKWKIISLSQIATNLIRGKEVSTAQLGTGDYPAIRYSDIFHFSTLIKECRNFVNPELIKKPNLCEKGDILIALTSNVHENIGKVVVYEGDEKPIVGSDILLLKHSQNGKFLSYVCGSNYVRKQFIKMSSRTTVSHVYGSTLSHIKIPLPSLEEQNRIVEALDKLRTNIESLQNEIPLLIEDLKKQYIYYREQMLNPEITN